MLKVRTLTVGQMRCNCYIIYNDDLDDAIIIDSGDDADFIAGQLSLLGKVPGKLIATHGHFDHNFASYELQKGFNIPFMISENDHFLLKKMPQSSKYYLNNDAVKVPKPDRFLKNGQNIIFGDSFFKIMETPGHTPGSLSLFNPYEKIIFTGDTIFANGAIGRYDYSYSSKDKIFRSLKKILSLPKDTIIYPGHGDKTSVKKETSQIF